MNTIDQELLNFSKKGKIIKLFNPFQSRDTFGCPPRLCCNTYVGCKFNCSYCYNHWQKDFINPRPKKEFEKSIEKDINLLINLGLEKLIISISNSTDPLQPIEANYRHSLLAFNLLSERNLKLLIVTKNPAKLLENAYLKALKPENTAIEVSISFLEHRIKIEPYAPTPQERIEAVKELIKVGFNNVGIRVDPVVPKISPSSTGQSTGEIKELVNLLSAAGVNHIISKVLRLVGAISKANPEFYLELREFYKANGKWEGNCYVLTPKIREELLKPVYEACVREGILFSTCYEVVSFPGAFKCDLTENKLGVCKND